MITEVLVPQKLVSYEKVPVSIYSSAPNASKAVANEIAELIKHKENNGQHAVLAYSFNCRY